MLYRDIARDHDRRAKLVHRLADMVGEPRDDEPETKPETKPEPEPDETDPCDDVYDGLACERAAFVEGFLCGLGYDHDEARQAAADLLDGLKRFEE